MEDIKEICLKREEAIQNVKYNLRKYAELKTLPRVLEDRVSSFSSFLINVTADSAAHTEDNKILRALINEEEDKEFIKKYDYLLTCLCPESNNYLIRVYFNNEKIQAIKEENSNIWYSLKDAYEILACLDENIEYTIEDYTLLKDYENKNKNYASKVRSLALEYLKTFKNSEHHEEINQALLKTPERERNQLMKYINEDNTNLTSYQYRMVLRGILIFAYYFKYIDFEYNQLQLAIKKTGSGWRKIMDQIE